MADHKYYFEIIGEVQKFIIKETAQKTEKGKTKKVQVSINNSVHAYGKLKLLSQLKLEEKRFIKDFFYEALKSYSGWVEDQFNPICSQMQMNCFPSDAHDLPWGSFYLSFTFTLSDWFTSKDDVGAYFIDNPIKKDWVTRLPYLPATSWKGAFHHALRMSLHTQNDLSEEDRLRIEKRLLGSNADEIHETDHEGDFRRGRLNFYPSFFDRVVLKYLNPQDRERWAGTDPIRLECVPEGGKGNFCLMYIPIIPEDPALNLPGVKEILEDLNLTMRAIYYLMRVTGFGAKTSSGFGRIREEIEDWHFMINLEGFEDKVVLKEYKTKKKISEEEGS